MPKAKRESSKIKSDDLFHKIRPLPGMISAEMRSCGRSNCKCAKGELHGPYFYRYWYTGGRRFTTYVKRGDFQAVSAAVLANRHDKAELRQMIAEVKKDSRQLADLLSAYSRLCRIGL